MKVDSNLSPISLKPGLKELSSAIVETTSMNPLSKDRKQYNVEELIDKINKMLEPDTHIRVKVHDKTNTIMVLVLKDETNEIIREIPSEKMLDLMYNMCTRVGVFLDEKM
ncbi:flagellar protein FlaG [Paenibacillus sp. UMB4589-SE434]|uniref:flagellar protein FlaG n=1 Tax=Paenibacillus sp. UMB4589-SE434 TaxID=3046314 RepID=UPI00254CA57C|nr:flagellar protein FlaG [Paenibacillus sp. UMB4589-SE434]MDK8181635.1 flagellar protein FlaG [Paenibacillus sp. UMB4589-SE434]